MVSGSTTPASIARDCCGGRCQAATVSAAPCSITPPSGKLGQYVVDIQGDATIAGAGQFVTIDAGSQGGVAPGNVFVVYRTVYPSVPSPRNVLGGPGETVSHRRAMPSSIGLFRRSTSPSVKKHSTAPGTRANVVT